jgi:MarR family transcriptional regulator, 2-MHQ and catechol-resistance regulon repressor
VTLTVRGETLMREVFPRHVEGMVQEWDVLTAPEQEELKRLCRKLGVGAAAED